MSIASTPDSVVPPEQDGAVWPPSSAFRPVPAESQFSDGTARCTGVSICDSQFAPANRFRQGERAHFFYEFELARDVRTPAGGIAITNADGIVVHAKNAYQTSLDVPPVVRGGNRLRFHATLDLNIAPGEYSFGVGLAGVDGDLYREYASGRLAHEEFAPHIETHCRVMRAGELAVTTEPDGKLVHYGLVNLPGTIHASVEAGSGVGEGMAAAVGEGRPTVFHVTHWKAGSQWIFRILSRCWPDRIVQPDAWGSQVRFYPIRRGGVYPTVYLTRDEFESAHLPPDSRRLVVIRDLRDTLVSAYFSFKVSHPLLERAMAAHRQVLSGLSIEDGLIYLMDRFIESCARIQVSWTESAEPLVKYEDLLEHDTELFEELLIGRCGLPISPDALREAVLACRFESLTGGRARGIEDPGAHERKGIAGDWRNHFTPRVKRAFKARYGGLLVATGYERDLSW
jgi:lipopolysaccharide transport system ATP-binding protein